MLLLIIAGVKIGGALCPLLNEAARLPGSARTWRRVFLAGALLLIGYGGVNTIGAWIGIAVEHTVTASAVGVQPGAGFLQLYAKIWRLLTAGDLAAARTEHTALLPAIGRWMDSVEHILAADKAVPFRRGIFRSAAVRRPGRTLDAGRWTLRTIVGWTRSLESWTSPSNDRDSPEGST